MSKFVLITVLATTLVGAYGCKKNEETAENKGETPAKSVEPTLPAAGGRDGVRFVVVTHGQASDPFWSVVQNGVKQAAKDMGVEAEYQAPTTFDMVAMGQLIDAAVASNPDGLIVSIPDAGALQKPIAKAIAAGIPVISINSGAEVAEEFGVLAHVGQTEYEAGVGAGQRMAAAGARNALCINQEIGNAALDLRCKGFTDAMTKAGGAVEVLAVDLNDPTETQQRVSAAFVSNSGLDSILTLGPTGAAPTLKALEKDKLLDKVKLATFDLSPEVLAAIRDGQMLFAIDQQQYLQGYLAVTLLSLYKTNLNTPGDRIIRTGPGFVTQDNAARIIDLSKNGTR
jgi:simple sugar transport system substrate-binding protein